MHSLVLAALGLCAASQSVRAQQDDAPPEPLALTEETVAELDGMLEAIELQRAEKELVETQIGSTDGVLLEILQERLETEAIALMQAGVDFAALIVSSRDDGYIVDEYEPLAVEILQTHEGIAVATWEQLTARRVFPDTSLGVAEQADANRRFFGLQLKIDQVMRLLGRSYALLTALGLDVAEAEMAYAQLVRERALGVSVYLDLSMEVAAGVRAGLSALPGDADLAAKLQLANDRIARTAEVLGRVVAELDRLDLETSTYREQLLTSTGAVTTDIFDLSVIGRIASRWGEALWEAIVSRGPTFVVQALVFALIILVFMKLSKLARRLTEHGLSRSRVSVSQLLHRMIVSTVASGVLAIGILIALSQLGISIGPLLAGLGIAGFVIGFALQDTLSNFASGLMILFYRPFDVGDIVEVGGVFGKVDSMSLVNTTVNTFDNQKIILPNTMIWGGVIKNVTAQDVRRVDLVFGVSYADDIPKTEKILREIVEGHELVLDEPEPVIRLHELGDSSVNFVVRPWTKTEHYWDVYWDVMRAVKLRFDAEGVSIPFPQRDVHLIPAAGGAGQGAAPAATSGASAAGGAGDAPSNDAVDADEPGAQTA